MAKPLSPSPKFQFSNVVVVEGGLIGVVVKTWQKKDDKYSYEVYVRTLNGIKEYDETFIDHFIYSKYLSDEEREFYG